MIINMHSHLIHRNMWSEHFWDSSVKIFSKSMNIAADLLINTMLPQMTSANAERYVNALDEAGIDKGLVTGIDFGLSAAGEAKWSVEELNSWVASEIAEYPDKLYGLCGVDPRRGERAIKLVEKAINEWGMKGVKFYPPCGFYPNDPGFFPFYEKCIELDVPIFSHTAVYVPPLMEGIFGDPIYLDSVAAKFPDLKIVLVHLGGESWVHQAIEIIMARPNVFGEISGQQVRMLTDPKKLVKILKRFFLGPGLLNDKIMFGTDWPLLEGDITDKQYLERFKQLPETAQEYGINFKRSDIRKFLGKNAMKLLKL